MSLMKNEAASLSQKYEAALAIALAAEAKNQSSSTLNRKWNAVFAAQDALKIAGQWS